MTAEPAVVIGRPFPIVEAAALEVLGDLDEPALVVANDPPWSAIADRLPRLPAKLILAGSMELAHLQALAAVPDNGRVVVGVGGGTALDTAKYLAWSTSRPLIQIPTITSVDAGFTDAVGVRVDGRVRYVGHMEPRIVVLDIGLIRSAPPHLNRAGIGDILSCHSALWDWRAAAAVGKGPAWRADLAHLAASLLAELDAAAADVRAVTPAAVRWLADAYARVGAAGAAAGHSRFEEGSEHFVAYAYEHATGARHIHGELVAFAVAAVAHAQDNDPGWVLDVVGRCGTRAHPLDLDIGIDVFGPIFVSLRGYARAEDLDVGLADVRDLTDADADAAWRFAAQLPRVAIS
ncbi:MAG: iron-containing alcohol dehydrogenase [Acidimicrobiales bacterium]